MATTYDNKFAVKQAFECYLSGPQDDNKLEISFEYENWPDRYFKRFVRWYLRRNDVVNLEKLLSEQLADFCHHMSNWDSGLKKALLKDKEIDKLRRQLKNDKRKLQKALYRFKNQAVMDPKTRHIKYEEIKDIPLGEEQGDNGQSAVNLESTAVTSSTANITFVDERPVDMTSLHTGTETFSRDVHNDIAEDDWTLRKVLEREYPLKSLEWKVNDTWETPIYTNGVPKIITDDTNCMITRQLQFFSFLRAGVKVRVQLNGTKFHCGRLIVYFKPITWSDDTEENKYSVTCYPHFFLDASVSNSGEIMIPFTHLLSHFSQESGTLFNDSINTLGSINIRVYNPLQAVKESSQSLFGQVYVSLADPYVHLPTYNIQKFSYGNGYMQGLESFLKKAAGNAINSGLGLADKFTGGLVTGAGDAICNLLGISDKPLDPVSAAPVINRTIAPLSHGAGLDRSTRLGLSPIAQTNTSPAVLGATDSDFNILTLCKMPCLLDQKEWNSTATPNTKLFDMLVTPVYLSNPQYTADGSGRYTNYQPTMLAYVSRAFCLWRGSLKVKIQVVATQFHSGRLALVYDPHGTHDFNITDLEKNKSHNIVIMDIQEKQELVVELPNFMVRPWLRCDKFRSDANLVDQSSVSNPCYLDCDVAGVFRVFVLNGLVHPPNITDKVQINIFFYAGENFELTIPNPVAPLSARKGPTGVQYLNVPRYPWCEKGDGQFCGFYEPIINLYNIGAKLFEQGQLTAGATWYQATEKIFNQDTMCFVYEGKKIKYYMETATGSCADLIKGLPNYTSGGAGDVIERIDTKTTEILTDLEIIQPAVTEVKEKVNKMAPKIDAIDTAIVDVHAALENLESPINETDMRARDILSNTQTLMQTTNDVNIKTTQINNDVNSIKYNTTDVLQASGCYAQHIRGESDKLIQWRKQPSDVCDPTLGEEQGIESYTTTRENEGGVVTITEGNSKSQVAPDTVSENAMNMQTLLRRFYPLWVSSNLRHSNNFTVITIPVSPAFVPGDEDTVVVSGVNRRYEIHNLAWWSRLYTYWRGSMRYKVLVNADDADIYVWHNPVDTKDFHISSGLSYEHVTEQLNFATEAGVTRVQQGIEVEVPFYSAFNQLVHSHIKNKPDLRAQNGTLYIAVRNRGVDFNVSVFVSTGDDFFLNVLRAPPIVHEPGADGYVDGSDAGTTKYPDLQRSMGHTSSTMQIPETYVFDRWKQGVFRNCNIPDFAPQKDFRSNELPLDRQQTIPVGIEQGAVSKMLGIDDALEVGKNMSDQFKGINQSLIQVTDKIPSIMSFINTIKEQVPIAVQTARDGVGSLNDVATFGKWATNTLMIGTLMVEFAELIKSFTWLRLVKVIVMLCIYMKVEFHQIISWLIKQVQEMYEGYRPKANDGDMVGDEQGITDMICDHHDEVVMTMSAIATVIFCGIFGKLPKWKEIKDYVSESIFGKDKHKGEEQGGFADSLRSIHFSVMGARSINAAYEFFTKWIERFVSWIVGKECKELQMVRAFQEKSQAVIDWLDTIETLDVDDVVLDALTDVSIHNKVYALVDTGREFTKWTMQEDVPRNISMVIRDANKKLMDLVKRINAHRPGQGFRYAPFVVMLDGSSSVAKTNVMHEFTDMFREELAIPYFNSVYPIPTTAKYLDGYSGQTLIEWDDMLQSPLQDELAAEFINWRSNADFKPNMAVAEEKGKIHFLSKGITITTNSGNINLNTIRDMSAFRNRINIKFECHLAEGWTPARIKALREHDPTYQFMLFDAYFTNENGTNYELYRANMSFIDAKELTRLHFLRWNEKQNNLVNAYLASHGSLRIPPGIQIGVVNGDEQMLSDDEYEETPEMYRAICGGFTLEHSPHLKPEEMDEAQLFEYIFEDLDFVEKLRYYDHYKLREKIRAEQRSAQLMRAGRRSFWSIAKDVFKRGCEEIKKIATDIYEKYPRLIQTLGLITALGTGYALFSTIWTMFEKKSDEEAYESIVAKPPTKVIRAEMYEPVVRHPAKLIRAEMYESVVKNPVRVVKAEGKEQGSDDPEAVELGRNKIHPLLYNLGWQKSEYQVQLQGLAIGGKVLMAPYHFFRRAKDGDRFYFDRGNAKIEVEFVSRRLYRIRDKDCALYYVGAQFDSRKSILKNFVKEKDLGRLGKKISALLLGTTPDGRILEQACKAEANQIIKYQGKDDGAEEFVQVGWKYDVDTVKGQCGSMLIACSKVLPPPAKIVGMHTAGYTQSRGGFSIMITQEQIAETLEKIATDHGPQVFSAPIPPQVNTDPDIFEEQAGPKPEGAFTYWGTMDKRFCPSQPQKTCFRKTPFHGQIFESVKKPAALKPINGISPLKKALSKYGKLTSPFSARHIKAVRTDILIELSQFESDIPMEPTSLETAVFGLPGVPYCEKMNMNSSPGWPYQCLPNSRGQKGKAYLFDINNRRIKDELLKKNIFEREELAKEGERYPSIWRDCMKDELRPNAKVDEGKTRLFTIAPTDYTILVRKYFLAFEQMFYKNHSKFFSAVGINPESYEWTVAYNRLRKYGNKCCAGDFASYDGTLMADLMMEVGDIIDDWYKLQGEDDPHASTVRRVLIDEMIHTYQLINNCVYKTHQGNPSGNPLTVIINTIVNVFYMRLCWLEIMSEKCPKWATLDEYHQNVIEEAYGDDNRIVIREKVISIFNQVTITECLARHGITYTDEGKTGEIVPYRNLEDTSFLKRSYRFDEEVGKEIILPQIDLSTISEIINWYRDAEDMEEQLIANMRAALGFAFFHGKDFYENLNYKYVKAMRDNGMHPISITYTEQLDRFLAMVHGNGEGRYENFVELGF